MTNPCLTSTSTQTQVSSQSNDEGELRARPLASRAMLGDYEVAAPIGRGGFGAIWLARHRHTGEAVAIKVLHAELALSPQMVSRFEREARAISMLQHPNVVRLHELGNLADGRPYLVMEYLPGISLGKIIRRSGPLPPERVLSVLEPVASALAMAHEHGIIHRDVKASNVMICEPGQGKNKRVVLLDFGVAKLLEDQGPRLTAPLTAVGSPHCMAPEQIRGDAVDARTDVYGLGALAFYVLTGEPPFPGNRGEAMSKHLLKDRPRPSERLDITPVFDEVVIRAMSLEPAERYPGVEAFVAAFGAAARQARDHKLASAASSQTVRALGLYVDVSIDMDEADDDEDDQILEDAERILPLAEDHLGKRGYLLVHEIGNSCLFVLPVPESQEEVRSWLQRVARDASALSELLEQREGSHPRVRVQVHLHIGEAGMQGDTVEGGSLLEPNNWTSMRPWDRGVWISSAAAEQLEATPPAATERT